MKLMRILDDESVEETDALYLDGYTFGDRALEGLSIKLTISQEGNLQASADWPKGVDSEYWTQQAVVFAKLYDCFSTEPDLSNDAGFILIESNKETET